MKDGRYPNVTCYLDRHGKRRWRYRKSGFRTYNFRTDPTDPLFKDEYLWAAGNKAGVEPASVIGYRRATKDLQGLELVYFIGPQQGPVKIGRTVSIDERLKKLQTGHHKRLHLLAVIPGGESLEAEMHRRFAGDRLEGEWFRRSAELVALMRRNRPDQWRTDLTPSVANLEKREEK